MRQPMPTPDFATRPDLEPIAQRVRHIVHEAKSLALEGKKLPTLAVERVDNALCFAFQPYVFEAEVIASCLVSPEYEAHIRTVNEYLGQARIGWIACPDGRIVSQALGDARVASIYRKLRGMPRTKESSHTGEPLSVNPAITASITSSLHRLAKENHTPLLIEFIGPHIFSSQPTHGCGAAASELSGTGSGLPVTEASMHDGGLSRYFSQAEATGAYEAFNNVARRAGGQGVSFDMTHDIHSQGLIFGLRHAYKEFDPHLSLRKNLLKLASEDHIVMTELLTQQFAEKIISAAKKLDKSFGPKHPKDLRNYLEFTKNTILLSSVALMLTQQAEQEEFTFIPQQLLKDCSDSCMRALAYHLLRNAVYQVVGGIKPGDHPFIHHPERVLRTGTIGADFNGATIPFNLGTPALMTTDDQNDAFALYQLMGRFLPEQGVDLEKEARIIMVTGAHNPDVYKTETDADYHLTETQTLVLENARSVGNMLEDAKKQGYAVVLPLIQHTVERSIISVITD